MLNNKVNDLTGWVYILLIIGLVACSCSGLSGAAEMPTSTAKPVLPLASMLEATEVVDRSSLPLFIAVQCPFILPDDYRQGQNVDCGYLLVPEVRGEANTRVIRLAVAIFHPSGGAGQSDPLFFLSGGPGASALELIRYQFDDLFAPVMEAAGRDLVIFDQRGVGLSLPALDCPAMRELTVELMDRQIDGQQINDGQAAETYLDAVRVCQADLSKAADLSAYHSAASAADVEDLRMALGYNQINLWGGSYGTRLGLEVMRLYPAGLRSVVLDAVYPPDVDLYLESPANLDRSLELLFVSCAANAVCNQKFPDLRTVFYQTIERLEVSPQMRTIEDPFSGVEYQALMDGDTLLSLVFQVLYESRLRYLLPELIYDASRGEFETFDKMRGSLVGQMDLSSRGMMFSVQCHEELAFSTLAELEEVMEAYPHLARMYEYAIVGKLPFFACDLWSAGMAPSSANQPVQSDIPTLLMAGEFDPITPPSWAFQAAETLENGYVFEYPGIGHGATAVAGCSRDMMLVFLNNPGRAPDDGCISEMSH